MEEKVAEGAFKVIARVIGVLALSGFVTGLSAAVGQRIAKKVMDKTNLLREPAS